MTRTQRLKIHLIFFLYLTISSIQAQDFVIIENSVPIGKTDGGLGTTVYSPTKTEEKFLNKVDSPQIDLSMGELPRASNVSDEEWRKIQEQEAENKKGLLSPEKYSLESEIGHYVGWFGIIRRITIQDSGDIVATIEHKYFDGLTDFHIQIVSIYGAGDFNAYIKRNDVNIPPTSLVRVYGKVMTDKNNILRVEAEYMRVWDWGLFSFMDYGKDKSNSEWKTLRKVDRSSVYTPHPDRAYYESILGLKGFSKNK